MAKQKIEHLEERLKIYEEANKELKKDFLLSRLRRAEAAVSEKPGTILWICNVIHAVWDVKGTEKCLAW